MIDIEQFVEGYVDGLKDSGQWIEMTKQEKKESGKEAIDYAEKMKFHFDMLGKYCKTDIHDYLF